MQNKIFQPKVIIGSITSFVVAAVGIIAVFFPSVFNLEKSSMGEGQFLLSDDEKTHKKLWEFLGENQGKVVQLEIAYCADFEKMNFAAVKNPKGIWWYYNELPTFKAVRFIPYWFLGIDYQGFENVGIFDNISKQLKYTTTYYEWLGKPEKSDYPLDETRYGINYNGARINSSRPFLKEAYQTDYIGRPPVIAGEIASFHTFHYGNDSYPDLTGVNIENGGISFAFFEGKHEYESPKSKDILISHPSNKNRKYIWVVGFENVVSKYLDKTSSLAKQAQKTCKTKQIKPSDLVKDFTGYEVSSKEDLLKGWGGLPLGYIKGTFYIHEKEEAHDEPGLWFLVSYNRYGSIESEDFSREKFELEPFDKKDIEMRKY